MKPEDCLKVYVLFRFSNKTGKIDMTLTAMGNALLRIWSMNNTPSTKSCFIFERESGKLVFATLGGKDGWKAKSENECTGTCDDYGIPLDELHAIKDDRWDN